MAENQKINYVVKKNNSTELCIFFFAFYLSLIQNISLVLSNKTYSHGFREAVHILLIVFSDKDVMDI